MIRTERDELQTAIDREVHQDHYHTSVQPVQDRQVLPEQHIDRVAPVENRSFQHGNPDQVKQRLAAEAAQFKNSKHVSEVEHTSVTSPTISGEHVHHHVHEIIQPVVQKETIQPSVVHTTIPIHEVHQNEPKHHSASQLPAVTMEDFKRQGGYLTGREEHTDSFEGEPKSVGGTLGGSRAAGTTSLTEGDYSRSTARGEPVSTTSTGLADSTTAARTAAGFTGAGTGAGVGTTATTTTSSTGGGVMGTGASYAEKTRSHGSTSSGGKRHNLMDKLNPMKSSEERSSLGSVH